MTNRPPPFLRADVLYGSYNLLELKQIDEPCHRKNIAQISIHARDEDMTAFGLGILKNAEEQTQAAR